VLLASSNIADLQQWKAEIHGFHDSFVPFLEATFSARPVVAWQLLQQCTLLDLQLAVVTRLLQQLTHSCETAAATSRSNSAHRAKPSSFMSRVGVGSTLALFDLPQQSVEALAELCESLAAVATISICADESPESLAARAAGGAGRGEVISRMKQLKQQVLASGECEGGSMGSLLSLRASGAVAASFFVS
jgi:hypothetical protein